MSRNYYGFRVDSTYDDKRNFFFEEILQGRLRQGWGFLEGQNLMNQTIDRGANRNRCMLNVKYGDILLIPHIPTWSDVTIVDRFIFSDDLAKILTSIAIKHKTNNIY